MSDEGVHSEKEIRILLVGAGGIGSTMVDLLIPALRRVSIKAELHLMDSDIVEVTNLGHQQFSISEIGLPKVQALANRLDRIDDEVRIFAHKHDLREAEQLSDWDAIIVAVDRPFPRRLVHASGLPWADLRSTGDGWLTLTYQNDEFVIDSLTPDHAPGSCQVTGALENGNIEFGFSGAATFGAQWCLQFLRLMNGKQTQLPKGMMFSLTHGALPMPKSPEVTV